MIKYKLECKNCEITFDSWFATSKEYEKLKDHIANSVEIETDDFSQGELAKMGGIVKANKVFGPERLGNIIQEMNLRVGG